MMCQKCHKSVATVRYAEVVDGKVSELLLCQECLSSHQKETVLGFELASQSGSRKKTSKIAQYGFSRNAERKTCRSCGLTLETILETGSVGCAQCYTVFNQELLTMVEDLHGATHHLGKPPRQTDDLARLSVDLQAKRTLLRDAVTQENFEEAAQLRDEIRQLEQELASAGMKGDN